MHVVGIWGLSNVVGRFLRACMKWLMPQKLSRTIRHESGTVKASSVGSIIPH